jgi:hypothetical protein
LAERDIIAEAKEAFDKALECESENRNEALDDIEFAKLGKQWPEAVRRQRELEGRPCLTINRLPPLIRQVVNDARQNKPAISVHPVDSDSDPETAEIFNGLIRQIEQSSDAEVAYDTALDCAVTSGVGYFRINTRYATDDSFEQDIVIERVANPSASGAIPTRRRRIARTGTPRLSLIASPRPSSKSAGPRPSRPASPMRG